MSITKVNFSLITSTFIPLHKPKLKLSSKSFKRRNSTSTKSMRSANTFTIRSVFVCMCHLTTTPKTDCTWGTLTRSSSKSTKTIMLCTLMMPQQTKLDNMFKHTCKKIKYLMKNMSLSITTKISKTLETFTKSFVKTANKDKSWFF